MSWLWGEMWVRIPAPPVTGHHSNLCLGSSSIHGHNVWLLPEVHNPSFELPCALSPHRGPREEASWNPAVPITPLPTSVHPQEPGTPASRLGSTPGGTIWKGWEAGTHSHIPGAASLPGCGGKWGQRKEEREQVSDRVMGNGPHRQCISGDPALKLGFQSLPPCLP